MTGLYCLMIVWAHIIRLLWQSNAVTCLQRHCVILFVSSTAVANLSGEVCTVFVSRVK